MTNRKKKYRILRKRFRDFARTTGYAAGKWAGGAGGPIPGNEPLHAALRGGYKKSYRAGYKAGYDESAARPGPKAASPAFLAGANAGLAGGTIPGLEKVPAAHKNDEADYRTGYRFGYTTITSIP